ncbi:MAG: glycosyltransferase [Sulfurimonas sp.]|uniref:glycosyltransferase n=1 Tax=Sulfurimonas sp. TaxID=2022749 RepID=UPI003D0D934B
MNFAPIVLFTYNRPWHTRQTIEALQKNELACGSELFIFSDAPKNENAVEKVNEIREYIKNIDGFKKITIIERDKNWGLANSIIDGVTKVVNEYGKIIVLEDDLVTSPYFLRFMNEALEMYKDEPKVASIHGYIYPIEGLPKAFFIKGADCWGWATWREKWSIFEPDGHKLLDELNKRRLQKEADFNNSYGFTKMLKDQIKGKNNSWAIRWYMSAFLKDMLTLYPGQSYVHNIGLDGEGTHCSATNQFDVILQNNYIMHRIEIKENMLAKAKIEQFFKSLSANIIQKVKKYLRKLFHEKNS